jgi:pimeloyl-ACP methyl ester carboxylesterase
MKSVLFRKKKIAFSDQGKGKVLVLLHGFTEDRHMWDRFAKKLAREFRVICIDLPGHGSSECVASVHSMDLQAEVVRTVLKERKVGKCILIGHSMGGYVTLAFAEKYKEMLTGFGLFHSHAFPDSPQDRQNRDRVIAVVEKDKMGFLAQFITGLFPQEVQMKYKKDIHTLIERARKFPKEGIIAALEGMKTRPDRTPLLKKTKLPVLFILGLKDSKAPVDHLWEMISLPAISESLILKNCGHMGYIEAPDETLNAIMSFARKTLKN